MTLRICAASKLFTEAAEIVPDPRFDGFRSGHQTNVHITTHRRARKEQELLCDDCPCTARATTHPSHPTDWRLLCQRVYWYAPLYSLLLEQTFSLTRPRSSTGKCLVGLHNVLT